MIVNDNNTNESPRIMATPTAFKNLKDLPYNVYRAFNDLKNECKINTHIVDKILNKVKSNFPDLDTHNILNWKLTMEDIIEDTEVWLVTDDDINRTKLPVINRFSKSQDILLVPDLSKSAPDLNSKRIQYLINEIQQLNEQLLYLDKKFSEIKTYIILLLIAISRLLCKPEAYGFRQQIDKLIRILWDIEGCFNSEDEYFIHHLIREITMGIGSGDLKYYINKLIELYKKYIKNIPYYDNSITKLFNEDLIKDLLEINSEITEGKLIEIIEVLKKYITDNDPIEIFRIINRIKAEIRGKRKEVLKEQNEDSGDWLACYCPQTGTIIMRIDQIESIWQKLYQNEGSLELLFQEILLHEFIHAALDLVPRDKTGKRSKFPKFQTIDPESIKLGNSTFPFNEETLDNVLVLETYRETEKMENVWHIIEGQPKFYSQATELFNFELRVLRLLTWLVAYKVNEGKPHRFVSKKTQLKTKQIKPTSGRGMKIARFIEIWANHCDLGNYYKEVAYQRIENRFPADLRGGDNSEEPIVYQKLPKSSDPHKNFTEIKVGPHIFYVAINIWTQKRFENFSKHVEETLKHYPGIPKEGF